MIKIEGVHKTYFTEATSLHVLKGIDLTIWRPWIIIAESKIPTETGLENATWESIILTQSYTSAYFDGINTFYVANERAESLLPALSAPPNTQDDFVRHSEWAAGRYAESLEINIRKLHQNIDESQQFIHHVQNVLADTQKHVEAQNRRIEELETKIKEIYASSSWKITKPLRAAKKWLSKLIS